MPGYAEPRCTRCGLLTSKILLTIKRVQFAELERPTKTIRQRVTERLCEKCRDQDPDWQREAYSGPNNKSAPLERVRNAQRDQQRG